MLRKLIILLLQYRLSFTKREECFMESRPSKRIVYENIPQPIRDDGAGATDFGPRDVMRDHENPDMLVPPATDAGTIPNLKFSFSDTHMQLNHGGWSREVTVRELPIRYHACRGEHASDAWRCA